MISRRKQKGIGLLEAVLAAGALAGAIMFSASALYQSARFALAAENLGQMNDLRLFVNQGVSCQVSLSALNWVCPNSPVGPQGISVIQGVDVNNVVQIGVPYSQFDAKHQVRVGCKPGQTRLWVEVQTVPPGGVVINPWHPLFWVPMDCPP